MDPSFLSSPPLHFGSETRCDATTEKRKRKRKKSATASLNLSPGTQVKTKEKGHEKIFLLHNRYPTPHTHASNTQNLQQHQLLPHPRTTPPHSTEKPQLKPNALHKTGNKNDSPHTNPRCSIYHLPPKISVRSRTLVKKLGLSRRLFCTYTYHTIYSRPHMYSTNTQSIYHPTSASPTLPSRKSSGEPSE